MQNTYTKIITGIHKYFKEANLDRAVIGVSGGIDSSLCLKLLVDAISPEKITALILPEKGVTSDENLKHAKKLCEFFEVEHHVVFINKYLTDYLSLPWKPNDLAQINTKARIRGLLLYNFANTRNALVIGTTNKSEKYLGYATKFGDLASDLEIIGDLFKGEVVELAKYLNLPEELINKTPTAELYPGQTDEDELGMTYKEIDAILAHLEKGLTKEEIINKGINPNAIHKVFRLVEVNRHKSLLPPVISTKLVSD